MRLNTPSMILPQKKNKKQKKNENFFDNSSLVRKEPNDDARHRYKKYSDYSVSLHPQSSNERDW